MLAIGCRFTQLATGKLAAEAPALPWFLFIAAAGLVEIVQSPGVLAAVNPWHAVRFFRENGFRGFEVLGAAVLAITGGEALYADMGHFGAQPDPRRWFTRRLPRAAPQLLRPGRAAPPRHGGPGESVLRAGAGPLLVPVVLLATVATIIASRRSSPARSRSPVRRCSSATCRA